jgi:hypothetical protein
MGRAASRFRSRTTRANAHSGGSATLADATANASNRAAVATGWHAIVLTSSGLPSNGAPFTFKIEYTAPRTLTQEQF